MNDRIITNARFIQVNQWRQIGSHLTAKLYVDNSIDEASLVRNNQDNNFNKNNLTNINRITSNKRAEKDDEVITKAFLDQLPQENERARRDVGFDFYDESNDLVKSKDNHLNDKKLTILDSITIIRNSSSDNVVANKKYIDDELDENTFVRFNQTLQNYLKMSVGNDTYNLFKSHKIKITDITEITYPNSGGYLLQNWVITANDKNNSGKIQNFIRSTKTSSGTANSGAGSLHPIGNSFMYIETSSANQSLERFFVSWERTNIKKIPNITFYYNRFSILTNDSLKSMGRFTIQLLLEDNTWCTQYTIAKKDRHINSDNEWTLLKLNFTVEIYGIKLSFDQSDTPHAHLSFSDITITFSVY